MLITIDNKGEMIISIYTYDYPMVIAVFDSGLGSLSAVRMLMHELNESIVYFADRANHPYGAKSKQELRDIVGKSIDMLSKEYNPKCILLASVTPSMLVLNDIRLSKNTLIFGTYLAIDKAFTASKSKSIAVLASKALVKSRELNEMLKGYIKARFTLVDASRLISLVESGGFLSDTSAVREISASMDPSIDTIILGSTHLSFLEDAIRAVYPNASIINPVVYTVARVKEYLMNHMMLDEGSSKGLHLLVSKDEQGFADILRSMGIRFDTIRYKSIN